MKKKRSTLMINSEIKLMCCVWKNNPTWPKGLTNKMDQNKAKKTASIGFNSRRRKQKFFISLTLICIVCVFSTTEQKKNDSEINQFTVVFFFTDDFFLKIEFNQSL